MKDQIREGRQEASFHGFYRQLLPLLAAWLLLLGSACDLAWPGGTGVATTPPVDFKSIAHPYPATQRDSSVFDTYFGRKVADPYRWLEQDTATAVQRWAIAEQQNTAQYLAQIPFRAAIAQRLGQLWDYARYGLPEYHGGYYYLFYNNGQQNQDVLYRTKDLKDSVRLVLDPNTWSAAGTEAMGTYAFSRDSQFLAYQVAQGGSDWQQIRVLNLQTGKVLADRLTGVKFSDVAWRGQGFYYSRYRGAGAGKNLTATNEFHQLYYHQVGTPQVNDELVFADRTHPQRNVRAQTDEAERWLVLTVTESTSGNACYLRDLRDADPSFVPVAEDFDHDLHFVAAAGDRLLFLTNKGAPNYRLVQISGNQPSRNYWEELVPERPDVLQSVVRSGDKLLATYLRRASNYVVVYDLTGEELREIRLPELGTVTGITKGNGEEEVFFGFTSFTRPETVYRLHLQDYTTAIFRQPVTAFKSNDYVTRQVQVKSYDGTLVPVFLIYKKDLPLGTPHPTLLYGYGGFNISMVPQWNLTRLLLIPAILENGGMVAVANLRGGGEFGSEWHTAGTLRQKQNVFDDFQAVAEYLIAERYTSREKLGIYGRSNGGLLVGACLTQRPDLYQVAFPVVGVLDMMRYHQFTIGWAWATDYGTSADSVMSDYLLSYSPLHNVEPQAYPATMITTADHDDRVVPAHSFKFAAELQHQQRGAAPILLRIDESAGHGSGKPLSKRIDEGADVLSFFFYQLKEPWINELHEPGL
jgi:prolyl oligopeptidase